MTMRQPLNSLCAAVLLLLTSTGPLAAQEAAGDLLASDSFEQGTKAPDGWKEGTAVPGVKYVYDRKLGSEGERSLGLDKTVNRYFPIAGWSRVFEHRGDKPALKVAAKVKAARAAKAIVDVQFLDAKGAGIKHEWAAYIGQKESGDPPATHDWKLYEGTMEIPPGTKKIGIEFQIYGPGKVWFDELQVRYVDSVDEQKADSQKTSQRSEAPSDAVETPAPIEIRTPSGSLATYLLIPPGAGVAQPAGGHPLLIVLPGGNGSADFHPFIRRIHEQALDGAYIVAQPIAPLQVVWPTKSSTASVGTTEESLTAIIDDVARRHAVDRAQVYALAWSSSGPAVYAALLQEGTPLAGAFIAMSVFKPDQLPPLENAAGRRVYLLHSPEDAVCPYWMAQAARKQLAAAGTDVTLVDTPGGHGWHGPVFDQIRTGMAWLRMRP
jgi:predicted esterase